MGILLIYGIHNVSADEYSLSLKIPWDMISNNPDNPKKQLANGVKYNEILCDTDKSVIYKTSDGIPACVQTKHAEKFVYRGWGIFGETSLEITTDKKVYSLGENVTMIMKNNGETTLIFSCHAIFHILDASNNTVQIPVTNIMPPCASQFPFGPNSETTLIWRQMDKDGQVESGNYTVVTKSFYPWYNSYLTSLTYDDEYFESMFQTTNFRIIDDS